MQLQVSQDRMGAQTKNQWEQPGYLLFIRRKVYAKKFMFWGTRERIIDQASYTAMQLLRRLILDLDYNAGGF